MNSIFNKYLENLSFHLEDIQDEQIQKNNEKIYNNSYYENEITKKLKEENYKYIFNTKIDFVRYCYSNVSKDDFISTYKYTHYCSPFNEIPKLFDIIYAIKTNHTKKIKISYCLHNELNEFDEIIDCIPGKITFLPSPIFMISSGRCNLKMNIVENDTTGIHFDNYTVEIYGTEILNRNLRNYLQTRHDTFQIENIIYKNEIFMHKNDPRSYHFYNKNNIIQYYIDSGYIRTLHKNNIIRNELLKTCWNTERVIKGLCG